MNTLELRNHLAAGGAAVFDLSDRPKFQLSGADRVRYLNGQVSNDVRRVATGDAGSAMPACVMTAKGKMNAFIWVSAGPDVLRIDADAGSPELREALAARLERYIISDDAELADCTEETRLVHLVGLAPEAAAALEPLPERVALFRSRRFGIDGVDLVGPPEAVDAVRLPEGSLAVDAETAETFRIEQGVPRWGAELNENTIPVEAGLDATAIDYHKGCYIGQEVISRIRSIGHVNRRLCGFVAARPLAPGAPLFVAEGEGASGAKEAGVLTSTAWSFALDKAVALGYLKRGIDAPRFTAAGEVVELRELPLIA